jgi:tRNA(Leu) C34 or U34 (ribose-2'-O)-methylase TrmL
MTAYLLFTPYDYGNRPTTYIHVGFWCGLFANLVPALVEPTDGSLVPSARAKILRFTSYQEAVDSEHFAGMQWVWLDETGNINLDEFEHPADNVVYVLGQEQNGFGSCITKGAHVYVRTPTTLDSILSPSVIVPLLCYDRWAYVHGGRG